MTSRGASLLQKVWEGDALSSSSGAGLAAFQQLCGINGLMSYSNILFEEAESTETSLTGELCSPFGFDGTISFQILSTDKRVSDGTLKKFPDSPYY
eukprot:394546-Amphidinium_carterae.1